MNKKSESEENTITKKYNRKINEHKFSLWNMVNIFKYQIILIIFLYFLNEVSYILSPYLMTMLYKSIENYYEGKTTLSQIYKINIRNTLYWCLMSIFSGLCKSYGGILFSRIEQKVKIILFKYFHSISYEDFIQIHGEKAFSYLTSMETHIKEIIHIVIIHIIPNLWTIIINIFLLNYFVPNLFLLIVSWIFMHISFILFTFKKNQKISKKIFTEKKQMKNSILESFLHILMIKVTNTSKYEIEKLNDQIRQQAKSVVKFIISSELIQSCSSILGELILWGGGLYIIISNIPLKPIPVSNIMYLVMVIYGLQGKIRNISTMTTKLIESVEEYKNNMEVLSQYTIPQYANETLKQNKDASAIKLNNVCFSLKEIEILKNISLEIKQGERVCFIGHSGSGKSTMMNLFTGIYRKYTGEIFLYGQNIKNIKTEEIVDNFSIINQSPMLLNRKIRENLVQNKNVPENTIIKYCKIVQIHDFIMSLPEQYDTVIHGKNISGGQAQRICLARMLLREKPFYIFDEATTGLDQKTKSMFLEAVFDLLNNYENRKDTMIFIDHSLAFLHRVDRIIMMEKGKIIFDGTYEEIQTNFAFLALKNESI